MTWAWMPLLLRTGGDQGIHRIFEVRTRALKLIEYLKVIDKCYGAQVSASKQESSFQFGLLVYANCRPWRDNAFNVSVTSGQPLAL